MWEQRVEGEGGGGGGDDKPKPDIVLNFAKVHEALMKVKSFF
jgi:hypothetical protein